MRSRHCRSSATPLSVLSASNAGIVHDTDQLRDAVAKLAQTGLLVTGRSLGRRDFPNLLRAELVKLLRSQSRIGQHDLPQRLPAKG